VSRLRARLYREAYARHRHDTYTVCLTEQGVQEFDYRGTVHRSLPGQLVILHPDEAHDGRAATAQGFAYRTLYIDPGRVFDAVRAIAPGHCALPFIANPVVTDRRLADVLSHAFDDTMEPLREDALVHAVAAGLLRAGSGEKATAPPRALDLVALRRTSDFLTENFRRVVRSVELEKLCGLSRFELCTQFKRRFGTSPYRYLLMRRLEYVREQLGCGASFADLAFEAGFADHAHMTRQFKAAFGLTPHHFTALRRAGDSQVVALAPRQSGHRFP
jgi:AraC-like DNA-binding protein